MADYDLKSISPDTSFADGNFLFGADDQSSGTPKPYSAAGIKTWVDATHPTIANNLSDLASAATARTNLGMATIFGAPPAATAIANVYHANAVNTSAAAAMTALRLYMVPIFHPGGAVTTMAFTVATGGAGGTVARLGLYNMKINGTPGTLIEEVNSAATIAVDTTGTKTGTISQTLKAGWYFGALISDGAPTVGGSTDALQCLGTILTGTATGIPVTFIYRTLGALAALGDETSNSFTANGIGSFRPIIGLK